MGWAKHIAGPAAVPLAAENVTASLKDAWETLHLKGPYPRTRVTTMNLMVCVQRPEDTEGLGELLDELALSHPSRTVVLALDSQAEGPFEGWVSLTTSKAQVVGERLVFYLPGDPARAPSLAMHLLISGLPTVLWWRGDPPFGSPLLERLIEASDRVIFDASRFNLANGLMRVARLLNDPYHVEQAFSDLCWSRLSHLREEVAANYDGPGGPAKLKQIEQVEVFCPGDRPSPESQLLLGWLCSRLDWTVERSLYPEGKTYVAKLTSSGRSIGCRVQPSGDRPWEVRLSQERLSAPEVRGISLMRREFDIVSRDPIYEQSLQMALVLSGDKEVTHRG